MVCWLWAFYRKIFLLQMYLLGVPSFEVHSNFSKDFLCSTFDEKDILPVEICGIRLHTYKKYTEHFN